MDKARIITAPGRQALLDYKYVSSSKSHLDNLLNGWWEFVVSLFPLSIAPNVITFAATTQYLISFGIFEYYDSDLHSCPPSWVFYQIAISMFIYQTLDAIDGKQARRTKQSSPLGQLFDHGNDALIFTPMLMSGLGTVQYGTHWMSIIVIMCGYIVFYMLNWRARHEGQMHFGIFSVTEAQFLGMGLYVVTGYLGCDIWTLQFGSLSFRTLLVIVNIILAIGTSIVEFMSVQKYYKKTNKSDPGQFIELGHMTLFVLSFCCWNLLGTFEKHPTPHTWIAGLIFSGMIHRLIVHDVTHMDTKKFPMLLAALPFILIGSLLEYNGIFFGQNNIISMTDNFIVYGILIYVFICWLLYVLTVINEICDTLKIRLFVITPKNE